MYAKYAEMHHSAARGRLRGGADFSNRRDEYARFVGSVPGGIVSLGAPPPFCRVGNPAHRALRRPAYFAYSLLPGFKSMHPLRRLLTALCSISAYFAYFAYFFCQ